MKNLVVTGTSGNLGKSIIKLKESNFKIIPLTIKNIRKNDFKKLFNLVPSDFELLHLGWPVANIDYKDSKDNSVAAQNTILLFEMALLSGVSHIYGIGTVLENAQSSEIFEDSVDSPTNLYAEQKIRIRKWLQTNAAGNSSWMRIGYQISAFDPKHKLIPTLLSNQNQKLQLKDADSRFDFIHRDDVASGIWNLIKREKIGKFQNAIVSCGRSLSAREIATELNVEIFGEPSVLFTEHKFHPTTLLENGWIPKFMTAGQIAEKLLVELRQDSF